MLSFAPLSSQEIVARLGNLAKPTVSLEPDRLPDLAASPSRLLPRLQRMAESGGAISPRDLERIIGPSSELLDLNYLRRGLLAARPVCRIEVKGNAFDAGGFGSGFLVGPRLLLTNHHVLPDGDTAKRSKADFDLELDLYGMRQTPVRFTFEPDSGFWTDPVLDYSLVAVSLESEEGAKALEGYGFLRLNPRTGKAEVGEAVSIIGHPSGEPKQVALRDNHVLAIGTGPGHSGDDFLWYQTDTLGGNSGSPVFNDQWQVVALHHAGVPATKLEGGETFYRLRRNDDAGQPRWVRQKDTADYGEDAFLWVANEGVRISSIAKALEAKNRETPAPLLTEWLEDLSGSRPYPGTRAEDHLVQPFFEQTSTMPQMSGDGLSGDRPNEQGPLERGSKGSSRSTHPDSYYAGRTGYDPQFLGFALPLPDLSGAVSRFGATATLLDGSSELKYTHFSVVMCAPRRLAFVTAVNIDGKQSRGLPRDRDVWFYDGRLDSSLQIGDELYSDEPDNYFDRGHLVRRQDPVWGEDAVQANEDTFHWTNCSPQYWAFNQGSTLWQGLENFILYNTDADDLRATVFTGPVFSESDTLHRGVLIPQRFFKLVAVLDGAGILSSSAYVVSQEQYALNVPFERLPTGPYRDFQVSIASLEGATGLHFGEVLTKSDAFTGSADRSLRGLADLEHPRRGQGTRPVSPA